MQVPGDVIQQGLVEYAQKVPFQIIEGSRVRHSCWENNKVTSGFLAQCFHVTSAMITKAVCVFWPRAGFS